MELRRVDIRWVDAEVDAGWQDVADLERWRTPWVQSMGRVLHEATAAEPWWTLLGCYSARGDDRQGNRQLVIPAGMVQRVEWLD